MQVPTTNQSRTLKRAHWCQLKPESLDKSRFSLSPDPPRIPLKKGDFEKTPVPPFLRGARGVLALIAKQPSVTGFDVKLTPMGSAVSLQLIEVGKRHCRVLACHSGAAGIEIEVLGDRFFNPLIK